MSNDLHQRLLDQLAPSEPFSELVYEALRAVVELHAPVALPIRREGRTPWLECGHCIDSVESDGETLAHADWPCATVQAIARELGIRSESAPT